MAKHPAQKSVSPRDPDASGVDKSSPVMGKPKRDLYLVPDQELPESSGDLADMVETEKEVLHEKSLKKSFEPMPGMSERRGPKLTGDQSRSPDSANLERGKAAPDEVPSATPVSGKSIDAGGATSGTTAGFGGTDRGKPTDASAAGMTGFGTAAGMSNHGSPGSIATHGPGQSGPQIKRPKKGKV
ncbi:MAG: hypothetical protein ACJ763_14760 [Bdellovibrionia bacterium]